MRAVVDKSPKSEKENYEYTGELKLNNKIKKEFLGLNPVVGN